MAVASVTVRLVGQEDIVAQDFWACLRFGKREMFETAIVLAAQPLVLQHVWDSAQSRWVLASQAVVVLQDTEMFSVPHETLIGPAMEETTIGYRLTCKA